MARGTAQDGTSRGTSSAREKARTARLEKELPEGLSLGEWKDGRRKPYFVRYGPKRKVESFQFESDRNDRAEALWKAQREEGEGVLDFDAKELAEWKRLKAETGATAEQIRTLWARFSSLIAPSMLTSEAVTSYLALRLKEDVREKTDTYRHMRKALVDCLVGAMGGMRLAEITPAMLRGLLGKLRDRDGKGEASSTTRRNYRKDWNTFFERAVREKWIQENPCDLVIPPPVIQKSKALMSVRDAFHFLQVNQREPVLPRIALEMFGFLRCSAAGRIQKEHVNFPERGIEMPGELHKSRKRKYRQGQPAVLWHWLRRATDETWDLSERMYDQRKGEAFRRAGVRNTGNILRHSCISYHLAAFKDFKTTSYLAQHAHTTTTAGYEGVAREADARLWMLLTPAAVQMTWEEFQAYAHAQRTQSHLRNDAARNRGARDPLGEIEELEATPGGAGGQGAEEAGGDPQGGPDSDEARPLRSPASGHLEPVH